MNKKTNHKNLITNLGYQNFQEELHQLLKVERPEVTKVVSWAAGNGDRSENADYQYGKKRLREIDRRAEFISKRLKSVQVIVPEQVNSEVVEFGATLKLLFDEYEGKPDYEKVFAIVGTDEVDVSLGKISIVSPLGAALIGKQTSDYATYRTPKGEMGVEILEISYISIR